MADAHVREIGRIEDGIAELPLQVGIDHGKVTIGCGAITWRLTPEQADELAGHIITATWRAQEVTGHV